MMRGITVCVNYDDLLAVTLPRNAIHLDEVVVVTSPQDTRTPEVVRQIPNARLFVTDAFYRYGATFNKGLAMEEGLDFLGRQGWLMIWDADTVLPREIQWPVLDPQCLYTPQRHILYDLHQWRPDLDWNTLPVKHENEWPGYCQIFCAEDPKLAGKRPWYGIDWWHAGGCDSDFQHIWPGSLKRRPGFRVLHIGEDGQNWCGRTTRRLDGGESPNQQENRRLMNRLNADWNLRLRKLPELHKPG